MDETINCWEGNRTTLRSWTERVQGRVQCQAETSVVRDQETAACALRGLRCTDVTTGRHIDPALFMARCFVVYAPDL